MDFLLLSYLTYKISLFAHRTSFSIVTRSNRPREADTLVKGQSFTKLWPFCYTQSMTKKLYLIHGDERIELHAVTSDPHVGHRNIAKYTGRPFDNTENTYHMDETLVNNHNAVVGEHETTLNCGDVALGKMEESLKVYERFNGTIILIPGNHDQISSVSGAKPARVERMWPLYENVFSLILPETGNRLVAVKDGVEKELQVSHYPSFGDSHDKGKVDRYAHLRPRIEDGPIVHGHTHATEVFQPGFPHQFHVGVEAHNLAPVRADVIVDWAFSL